MKKKYRIEYQVMGLEGVIKQGVMIVHRCYSELHAQVKLETHLRNKVPGFGALVVVAIKEEKDIIDFFNNLFKNGR